MLGLGLDELLLICFVLLFWILSIIFVISIIYNFLKNFLKGRDEHIKTLDARISQLEKDKMIDRRLDSLEKRFDEQQKNNT
jgi:hypothetical protein